MQLSGIKLRDGSLASGALASAYKSTANKLTALAAGAYKQSADAAANIMDAYKAKVR